MRVKRLSAGVLLVLLIGYCQAQPQGQEMTVTGKLIRVMAVGGESTGWVLELDSAIQVDGKQVVRSR
jgi:hypothetical protein